MEMVATDIIQYIPHRTPFVMLDALIYADEQVAESSFDISEGHLFVNDGFFTEPGLVENMAQTAAAGLGYRILQDGKPAPVGFIGALKNLVINKLPHIGETIVTRVKFLQHIMNARIVEGKVFINDEEIASCEFKIFIKP